MLYIQIVQRAFDLVKAFGSYVRVYLGGLGGIFVAEQALDVAQIGALLR